MIKVTLKGIERELKFSEFSLIQAEEDLEESTIGTNIFENLSLKKIAVLLKAALRHRNKNLTLEEVASYIPLDNEEELAQLTLGLMKAYMVAKGQPVEVLDEIEKKMKEASTNLSEEKPSKSGKPSRS